MIKQLLKLSWNRKRSHLLIVIEVLVCFLVLFGVTTLGMYYFDNYRRPLGFDYRNVWSVAVSLATQASGDEAELAGFSSQLTNALEDLERVETVSLISFSPWTMSNWTSEVEYRGKRFEVPQNLGSDNLKDVLGLQVVEGRWFSKEDDGMDWKPAVINESLQRKLFNGEDPIGKVISAPDDQPEYRVVGVINDFRKDGEFSGDRDYVFKRLTHDDGNRYELLVKLKPGTPVSFEETLADRLYAVRPDWGFDIEPLDQMRESNNRFRLVPLIAAGIVEAFLLLMVALGLIGVVWQNVSQRTSELGLRRALGASAGWIYWQISGELLVITSLGLAIGVLFVAQLPLLDLLPFVSPRVYLYGLVLSVVLVYGLTIACCVYPSRLATRIMPAEALHWE